MGLISLQAKRKRHISQFLGSLCSYFLVATIGLMLVFVTVFMSHGYNDSTTITLEVIQNLRDNLLKFWTDCR